MKNLNLRAHLAAIITVLLWSSAFVGIRKAVGHYPPGALALLRYLVASVCMLFLFLRPGKKRHTVTWRDVPKILVLGLIGFTIYNLCLNYAELSINSATASFIISLVPVMSALLAMPMLNERLPILGWVGLAVSVCGVILIISHENTHFNASFGLLLAFIAALACCLFSLLQKPLLRHICPFDLMSVAIWCGTAGMLMFWPQMVHAVATSPWQITAWVVYIGIFPAAVAYALWSYAIRQLPVARTTSYMYLLSLMTLLLAWLFLGELPNSYVILGGIIALLGAIIVNTCRSKTKPCK